MQGFIQASSDAGDTRRYTIGQRRQPDNYSLPRAGLDKCQGWEWRAGPPSSRADHLSSQRTGRRCPLRSTTPLAGVTAVPVLSYSHYLWNPIKILAQLNFEQSVAKIWFKDMTFKKRVADNSRKITNEIMAIPLAAIITLCLFQTSNDKRFVLIFRLPAVFTVELKFENFHVDTTAIK